VVTLLDVLDQLDSLGIEVTTTIVNNKITLRTTARRGTIDADLAAAITDYKTMIVNTLIGRSTGHAPAPCSACGEVTFTPILKASGGQRTTWPTCRFKPGCPGRHEPRQIDVDRTRRHAPPPQARPPRRPSRQRLTG
jgi:hypothetical protein